INPVRIIFNSSGSTITLTYIISGPSNSSVATPICTVSSFNSSSTAPSSPIAIDTPGRPIINDNWV
ncbi:hypothetical protein NEUTE1DRAFT_41312, partial [Neurospora tetrasperma FGSC 2508]